MRSPGDDPAMAATFGVAITGAEPWPLVEARVERLEAAREVTNLWIFDERFRRDPWVTLGLLAGRTERLALGTCVTDALIRHPALTGAAIATLAEATGGRAILGLGAGASGFRAVGIERHAPAATLKEAITFLRRLWAEGSDFDFEGSTFSFRSGHLQFAPTPAVPIMVAGRGPRILELAAAIADEVMVGTFTDGPLLDHALACVERGVRRRASTQGPLRRAAWVYVSVADERERARDAVREGICVALWGSRPILGELGITLPVELRELMDARSYAMTPDVIGRAAALVPDELIDSCAIAGTPSDCVARFRRLIARGFDHVALWPFAPAGSSIDAVLDRLMKEVLPDVAAPRPAISGRRDT